MPTHEQHILRILGEVADIHSIHRGWNALFPSDIAERLNSELRTGGRVHAYRGCDAPKKFGGTS